MLAVLVFRLCWYYLAHRNAMSMVKVTVRETEKEHVKRAMTDVFMEARTSHVSEQALNSGCLQTSTCSLSFSER